MARRVGRRAHEFAEHVAQVVAEVGGDRTVSEDSTIHRSVWHDTKTGRTLPHPERTWPAMRAYLEQVRPRVRWDGLYDAARAERERAAMQGNGSARPARARPRVLTGDRASLRAPVAAVSRAGLLDAAVAQRDRHARGAGRR